MLSNIPSLPIRGQRWIVPSVLTENFGEFITRLRQAEFFSEYVQIDIMDGVFVETRSFPVEKINEIDTPLLFEAHLMVNDPFSYTARMKHPGLRKVLFHVEAVTEPRDLIGKIRDRGLVPGLAVKPETEIDRFREMAEEAEDLLFLTVDPCCYGHPFKPEVIGKVERARKIFPDKVISVDGGVSMENLKSFFDIGVDYVCVGSRIFLDGDPATNYRLFVQKAEEMKRP